MSGLFLLDWALLGISLFNTILLFWLGLTVLLNAERQNWGIWLAGGGLLTGGVFFLVHTAILGSGLSFFSPEINLLWRLGWIPVLILPASWYLVNLWYAGYFDHPGAALHRRHRPWVAVTGLLVLIVFVFLIIANPLPDLSQALILDLNPTPTLAGVPVLIVFYVIYILFSTAPGPRCVAPPRALPARDGRSGPPASAPLVGCDLSGPPPGQFAGGLDHGLAGQRGAQSGLQRCAVPNRGWF